MWYGGADLINIYCDESCHLEMTNENKENQKSMVLGGISCPKDIIRKVSDEIRDIKEKHGINRYSEIKWTKVSPKKIDFYKDVINYFFNNKDLKFRTVVFQDKSKFYYNTYSHNDIYYIMYYFLLREMINVEYRNNIYIDKKDTRGGMKIKELKENLITSKLGSKIVSESALEFNSSLINKIQIIDSRDSEIMQLADILIGAVGYANRLNKGENLTSEAKLELAKLIMKESGYSLLKTTLRQEEKFNIFIWSVSKGGM